MKMNLEAWVVMLIMLICGALLILVGQADFQFLKIDIGSVLANVGAYVIFVGALNWIFVYYAKKTLIAEISNTTVGLSEIIQSGIERYYHNSKKIDFEDSLRHANDVSILFSYSPRFIDDYGSILLGRIEDGASVTLNFLGRDSNTLLLMLKLGWDEDSVNAAFTKIERFKSTASDGVKGSCVVNFVDAIPRYSLVKIDKEMYVIFSTCGNHRQEVPALKIKFGSPMWSFFDSDIRGLAAHA
ncbi:MAG: hypothetical protein ABJR10_06890 [Marinomonas sp.]